MKEIPTEVVELLVQRATEGLSDEEAEALELLLERHGLDDTMELDLAAAAAANAFALEATRNAGPAPDSLKQKLIGDADRFFGPGEAKLIALADRRPKPREYLGWAVAAMLAVLAVSLLPGRSPLPDPREARAALIEDVPGTEIIEWAPPEDPAYAAVRGDVVWNDARQEGYLLLANMPANDPSISQYQLWVVDPDRDANPVDGGVFDIPAGGGSIVVPIDVKLAVDRPAAFAITREQPGGVVVSDGPLLLVASAT